MTCIVTGNKKKAVESAVETREKIQDEIIKRGVPPLLVDEFVDDEAHLPMREILEDSGFILTGVGSYRVVYEWDDCVVKIARNDYGRSSNYAEYNTWHNGPEDLKELLVPVDEIGDKGNYITMPLVEPAEDTDEPNSILEHIEDELHERGYGCRDLELRNVGVYQDKSVILDYDGNMWDCLVAKTGTTRLGIVPKHEIA